MPLAITLGYTAKGRTVPPIVLYCGLDAGEGDRLSTNPPAGIVRTEFYKGPTPQRRREYPGNGGEYVPAGAVPAEAGELTPDQILLLPGFAVIREGVEAAEKAAKERELALSTQLDEANGKLVSMDNRIRELEESLSAASTVPPAATTAVVDADGPATEGGELPLPPSTNRETRRGR